MNEKRPLGLHLFEIEITSKCNINCAHCYNRGEKPYDMSLGTIIDLAKFVDENNIKDLVITGGEACLHPDFEALAKYFIDFKPKARLIIQTNGSLSSVDPELLKGFDLVHFSFEPEGLGVRDISVKNTFDTISRLREKGIQSYLFATIHSKNIDKIDWMVEVAKEQNVEIGFNLFSDNGKQQKDLSIPQNLQIEINTKMYGLLKQKKIRSFSCPMAAVFERKKTEKYIGIRGGCTAGVAICHIAANGNVLPCPFLRMPAGNIYENSFENIWFNSTILNELRNRRLFDDPCGSCEYLSYCSGCRSRAFVNTGKLTGHDPLCFKNEIEISMCL
jgi:radical SAM protein with 4Fe4S-binding SPASM domain